MALNRVWTQLNCQDIKTTYHHWIQKLYPRSLEVFKKKTTVTWTETWAEWFQLLRDLKRPKTCLLQKTQLPHCHQRAAQSQTARGKAHSGDAIQFLIVQHPHPISWSTAVCWWGKAFNSSTGNCQQHDVPNIAAGQWHQLNMTAETKAGHFPLNHTDQLQHHAFSWWLSTQRRAWQ